MPASAEPSSPRREALGWPCSAAAAVAAALGLAACPMAPRLPRGMEAHAEPELEGVVVHPVQAGETLWRIARRYGVKLSALARANGLDEGAAIKVGQELVIPPEAGDAAPAPAPASAATASTSGAVPLAVAPSATPSAPATAASARLAWPLIGVLYARFGPRGESRHEGIDVAAPEGTMVGAAGDGQVLFAGEQKGYGRLVIVEHEASLITVYAHNQENLVKEGQRVKRGQPLARVGEASTTSGPHLHFEVREGSSPKDPLGYLPPPP